MRVLYLAAAVLITASCTGHPSVPAPVQLPPHASDSLAVSVRVDSANHEIIVDAGPFDVPAMPPMMHHGDMKMDHGGMQMDDDMMMMLPPQLLRFDWPVDGWLRGFRLGPVDAQGHPLSSELLHHVIGVNFDRRQLVYDALERPFAGGTETGEVMLPKELGLPFPKGDHLGLWGAWHNETGKALHNVYLRAVLYWTPSTARPKPMDVFPFYADVHYVYGGDNAFDLPPGRTVKSYTFTQPITGRLLGIGGHLHDYGKTVSLIDAETGKDLVTLHSIHDDSGHVTGVSRKMFILSTLKLVAGHRYTVQAVYDNPRPDTIKLGAMAHVDGAFAPDDPSKWPAIDPTDPNFKKDVAAIPPLGATAVVMSRAASVSDTKTATAGDRDPKRDPRSQR